MGRYYATVQKDLEALKRFRFCLGCEYVDGVLRNLASGETWPVTARKVVDASYLNVAVPATHPPPFPVAAGATVIPPGDLPGLADLSSRRFVVIGAGKTSMDAVAWLLGRAHPRDPLHADTTPGRRHHVPVSKSDSSGAKTLL